LRAYAQTVHNGGERVALFEAFFAKCLREVGVPSVRSERAFPAVGLLVAGPEECLHALIARRATAAALLLVPKSIP
jgi:hypothetical protein